MIPLPEPAPVDPTRAGVLRIAGELFGDLLRLPAGHRTTAIIVHDDVLSLLVEGADMPSGVPPQIVTLDLEVRRENGQSEIWAHWRHRPEKEWRLR